MAIELFAIFLILQCIVVLLAISLGRSLMAYKIRKEETHARQLDLALMEQRARILREGKKIAHNLEELLYNAQVRKEIDDIIRKNGTR